MILSQTNGFVVYSAFIMRAPKKVYRIYTAQRVRRNMIQRCSADICFQSSPRWVYPCPLWSTLLRSITYRSIHIHSVQNKSVEFNLIPFNADYISISPFKSPTFKFHLRPRLCISETSPVMFKSIGYFSIYSVGANVYIWSFQDTPLCVFLLQTVITAETPCVSVIIISLIPMCAASDELYMSVNWVLYFNRQCQPICLAGCCSSSYYTRLD